MEKEQYEILWEQTFLPEIEKHVTSISFETHVKQLTPVDILGNKIILITPSRIFADAINNHPIGVKMREAFSECNTYINDFEIIVAQSKDEYVRQLDEEDRERINNQGMPINPKFTFDSFVVGSSNEFIYAAAKAVANAPGESYNPLFIHGGTGLGKTHILMAIANYIRLHAPSTRVLYATCEQFTNQLIESISKGQYEAGYVLGLSKSQIFRKIILKQVIQRIVPPMSNEIITLIKDTALANCIMVCEIIKNAKELAATKAMIWPLFFTGVFYLIFVGILTIVLNKFEKKLSYFRS